MKQMEKRGYCHYKVCEDKYENNNGKTRNPDVIYSIICEETMNCFQGYLNVDVALYKNGMLISNKTREIPAGCIYSVTDLKESTNVEQEEHHPVI
jgi:hypothetical protein